jgi:hypothetical protein
MRTLNCDARASLTRACRYLRDSGGRTATEGPKRILTAAMKAVGTDAIVDLNERGIKARLGPGKESPCCCLSC